MDEDMRWTGQIDAGFGLRLTSGLSVEAARGSVFCLGGGPTPMHPSTQPELKLPSEGCRGNFRGFRQFSRDPVFFVEQVFKRDMKIHVIILRFCWNSVVRADMSANRQREDTRGLAKRSTFVGLFAARSTPQTHRQPNRSPAKSRVISSDPGH